MSLVDRLPLARLVGEWRSDADNIASRPARAAMRMCADELASVLENAVVRQPDGEQTDTDYGTEGIDLTPALNRPTGPIC